MRQNNFFGLIIMLVVMSIIFQSGFSFFPILIILFIALSSRKQPSRPQRQSNQFIGYFLIGLIVFMMLPVFVNVTGGTGMGGLNWMIIVNVIFVSTFGLVIFQIARQRATSQPSNRPPVNPFDRRMPQGKPEGTQVEIPSKRDGTVQCPSCGFYTDDRFNICTKCGKRVSEW